MDFSPNHQSAKFDSPPIVQLYTVYLSSISSTGYYHGDNVGRAPSSSRHTTICDHCSHCRCSSFCDNPCYHPLCCKWEELCLPICLSVCLSVSLSISEQWTESSKSMRTAVEKRCLRVSVCLSIHLWRSKSSCMRTAVEMVLKHVTIACVCWLDQALRCL